MMGHFESETHAEEIYESQELCCSDTLPEVEIISLIQECIPRYQLRADTATQFTGYENQDWYIAAPAQRMPVSEELTPEQTKETLNYFLLCGDRVSQMTKTYNDVEAVTRLLDEKEKDLELAARIGQGLLARNKALEDRLVAVEGELTSAHDTVTQLRHDLSLKGELLQIYTNDFDDSSPEGVRAFTYDLLQRKVKGLEDDNRKLRAEASQLVSDSSASELREEQLLHDVLSQLADANNHIKNLDDELANKYEESSKQREEITSLLAQLVSQRHKIRELTMENEELLMQLRVVRDCQNELASELVDYKEKYSEILELLRETQEQLKQQNKRNLPTARTGGAALPPPLGALGPRMSSYHPDSLASELELSSLGSDGWTSSSTNFECLAAPNLAPRNQFQRVFDTVKCASQNAEPGMLLTSTPSASGPGHMRMATRIVAPSIDIQSPVESAPQPRDIRIKAEPEYPGTSRVGVPGTPGTVDLVTALRRLTPKTDDPDGGIGATSMDGYGWRTPDSIMSTGSRSAFSSLSSYQYPEKLKIIKPIEGSTTLHHWLRLATPHLGSLLEERPGVATRETEHKAAVDYTRGLLEMYSLFDVEEDEDVLNPGKCFEAPPSIYTYTNSTVLHPDHQTMLTASLNGACMTSAVGHPASSVNVVGASPLPPSLLSCIRSRRNSVSTFSTQLHLAKALQERGTDLAADPNGSWAWSGLSTPNNSPERTPYGSPPTMSYGPLELIQHGAKMIRRTLTGIETPVSPPGPHVPRISKKELEVLSKMNLMDKLEKLGLNQLTERHTAVSAGALQSALEHLAYSASRFDEDRDPSASDSRSTGGARPSPIPLTVPSGSGGILTRNSSAPSDLCCVLGGQDRSDPYSNGLNMIADIDPAEGFSFRHEVRAKFQTFDEGTDPPDTNFVDALMMNGVKGRRGELVSNAQQ